MEGGLRRKEEKEEKIKKKTPSKRAARAPCMWPQKITQEDKEEIKEVVFLLFRLRIFRVRVELLHLLQLRFFEARAAREKEA